MARWPDDQMTRFLLADFFTPVFESLLYDNHELVGEGAVDNAMVVAQREMNDRTNGDGIRAIFVGDYHGLFGDTADAHDGDVRLVDDGQAEDGAKLSGIGDGEGCTFDVSQHELLRTGALAEVGDAALQSEEVEFVGVLENGDDEPPIERDGDAGVDVLVVADAVAFERTIDDGILLKGDDGRAHKERHEGKPRAVALLETVLELVAQIDDAGHIYFEHAMHVSAGAARFDHALCDDLAHLGHGDEVFHPSRRKPRRLGTPVARNDNRRRGCGWTGCWGRNRGGGRVTKQDVLDFVEHRAAAPIAAPASRPTAAPAPVVIPGDRGPQTARFSPTGVEDLVPMSQMRKIIAQRMIESRRTSAHVHCMFEVDMTRIVNLRNKLKNGFEQRYGARLTFMPFFVRAAIIALQQYSIVNSSLEGDSVRYHKHVNAGIAVALDWGLIVPVLKNADELNFLGLQRGITDLGERARSKKLMPTDIEGATFTITNPGQFGAVFGLPIINQPNVAIMGVGGITKQPMVITDKDGADSIAIRSVVHLTLGYDHRIIDGALADQFMVVVKKTLENWSEEVG